MPCCRDALPPAAANVCRIARVLPQRTVIVNKGVASPCAPERADHGDEHDFARRTGAWQDRLQEGEMKLHDSGVRSADTVLLLLQWWVRLLQVAALSLLLLGSSVGVGAAQPASTVKNSSLQDSNLEDSNLQDFKSPQLTFICCVARSIYSLSASTRSPPSCGGWASTPPSTTIWAGRGSQTRPPRTTRADGCGRSSWSATPPELWR